MSVDKSPDGRKQVELYTATRWQRLWDPRAEVLGFARLSRVDDGEVLSTSRAFDMLGGAEVLWFDGGVQVSTTAVYHEARGEWEVLQ